MAAGLGFKTFTTGEVLTAADTNGYLMQGVLVFASAAARNAAITSPQEGQFAYTKDTNGLWYYDGAAWVASGATGDIEGVTAGTGISGGGTSGTVTITNSMATEITAAGDIIVGTGSGTFDNLPIGTTGQLLTADTTVSPYKVKWASAAGGYNPNYQIINSGGTALTAAQTITVSSISSKTDLLVNVVGGSSANGNAYFYVSFNGDTTAGNYYYIGAASTDGAAFVPRSTISDTAIYSVRNGVAASTFDIMLQVGGCNAAGLKPFIMTTYSTGTTGDTRVNINQGFYKGTSAITSLSIVSNSGNFDAGTIYVYGA
jgi:hypothetical protein